MDLSIVIPCRKSAPDVDRLVPDLVAAMTALGVDYEIIVATDAASGGESGSDSVKTVTASSAGYGGLVMAGVDASGGQYILTVDSHVADPDSFIKTLWAARDTGAIVIGSRYTAGASSAQWAVQRTLSRWLNAFYTRFLNLELSDLSVGLRLYQRRVFKRLELDRVNGAFLLEVVMKALAHGLEVVEVPIQFNLHPPGSARGRGYAFAVDFLLAIFPIWRMRNSVESADYDYRAYDSRMPLQRYWQRKRAGILLEFAESSVPTIDVGCGSGRTVASLPDAVGVDLRHDKLCFMRRTNRMLANASGLELPFRDESFGCVICSEVIEHIPDEDGKLIDELSRVLRPGGILVLGTPDYGTFLWPAIEKIYGMVAPGGYAHEHVTHYTNATMRKALEDRGYDVLDCGYVFGSVMIFKGRKPDADSGGASTAPRSGSSPFRNTLG